MVFSFNRDNYLPYHNVILLQHFHLYLFVFSLLPYRDLPLVIVVFSLSFHAFIIPLLSAPVFFFFSCSLASFNHPLLLWESRLCSSTEGPESLLIIPQHVSHLHKHAAKNKPFPCQPPYTLQPKIFPLIYKGCTTRTRIFPSPKIIGFAFCFETGGIFSLPSYSLRLTNEHSGFVV